MALRSIISFLWNDSRVGFAIFGLLIAGISALFIAQNKKTLDVFYGCHERSRVVSEGEAIRFARDRFGDNPSEFENIVDKDSKKYVVDIYRRDDLYRQKDSYIHPSWIVEKLDAENFFIEKPQYGLLASIIDMLRENKYIHFFGIYGLRNHSGISERLADY